MNSPRHAPAGLLVEYGRRRVMLDGGPGSTPGEGALDAWLVTDERAELMPEIRRLARARGVTPGASGFRASDLQIIPRPVVHTSHPTYGFLIRAEGRRIAWAPEFLEFPGWAAGTDMLFADAADWQHPIRFVGGVGGHAPALEVAREARRHGVRRLVFAHIGRPTIRAMESGHLLPFGRLGRDGQVFFPRRWHG